MHRQESGAALSRVFSELIAGNAGGDGFVLNSGDPGLLRSIDTLSADEASAAVNGGATIAAHAQHLRYGLSLMSRWATEGGNPFADATWDAAWQIGVVDETTWAEIRTGLRNEAERWLITLATPRIMTETEFAGMIASVAHLAYHLGAMRQINKTIRGPREGTFQTRAPGSRPQ